MSVGRVQAVIVAVRGLLLFAGLRFAQPALLILALRVHDRLQGLPGSVQLRHPRRRVAAALAVSARDITLYYVQHIIRGADVASNTQTVRKIKPRRKPRR